MIDTNASSNLRLPARAAARLHKLIERSFYELRPGQVFQLAQHIELIATKFEQVRHGETKRLIINLPPRSLKSLIVSVAFVAWMLGHDPTTQIICASFIAG
jgi:hypothetical protein